MAQPPPPNEGQAGVNTCLQVCGFTRLLDRNSVIELAIPNMRALLELKEEDAKRIAKAMKDSPTV